MNILEELWHGNIELSEKPVNPDTKYAQACLNVSEETERLLNTIPPDVRGAVEALLNSQSELAAIAERDAFVTGFSLAVRMLTQALSNEN